ncbi:hypothetical protein CAS74_002738 [Pichia kudriavzevii]|uniref:Zinc/cadmium resistance protein n=1 Tax=Pichia kudriavzevii TaxID=4909 RepID=A0A1Z8JMH2_PICKU|nr:hypothetical protein CAS74_002738 [Pichia kudriavzevii]
MGLSKKEIKILTLLFIDTAFFFLEIIVGYMVNSLALIADSFHMLNDIISLVVALWAVNVAKNRSADAEYTYGWLRAEILGALINAVFLIALCFTILIEALQRLLDPPTITNPKLILVVGTLGLISNIVGLFLFHEHGHSHGGGVDSGDGHSHSHGGFFTPQDEESEIEDVHGHNHNHNHSHADDGAHADTHADVHGHSHAERPRSKSVYSKHATNETTPLMDSAFGESEEDLRKIMPSYVVGQLDRPATKKPRGNKNEAHQKSMNMEGVFLHVLGDALGNIGVMASAIFIWKTDYSWKYYFDPFISLVITCIIFSSALPLCKRSSRILLQGTPSTVVTSDVIQDVLQIPSVIGVHDFHIWNLTEKLMIASLHIELDCSPDDFLKVASDIKACLHDYGVHSATIQPEFSAYYNKQHMLPHSFSSSSNLKQDAVNSALTTAPPIFNISSNVQSDAPASSSTDRTQVDKKNDIHCLIDASVNCTTTNCLK